MLQLYLCSLYKDPPAGVESYTKAVTRNVFEKIFVILWCPEYLAKEYTVSILVFPWKFPRLGKIFKQEHKQASPMP